ncbi:hypothetical protein EXIGLDRAFT_72735 [Exidia glandulosa HHB12029]|uniref:Uncharacterized protein n=1 Tax=Exidia glandulosa HHB12029 TaxID=1314781 RepID=A0A165HUG4_EXIGL|nr:hypothetical protein EXIGLDRAFT_72735 [Exidia glandulosa HHB12029]
MRCRNIYRIAANTMFCFSSNSHSTSGRSRPSSYTNPYGCRALACLATATLMTRLHSSNGRRGYFDFRPRWRCCYRDVRASSHGSCSQCFVHRQQFAFFFARLRCSWAHKSRIVHCSRIGPCVRPGQTSPALAILCAAGRKPWSGQPRRLTSRCVSDKSLQGTGRVLTCKKRLGTAAEKRLSKFKQSF